MAITTTDIKGTDSISASRITINDNISTIVEALNDVLSIVDIGTGKIDNSTYASLNNIKTTAIEITGSSGVTVNTGSINVSAGNVVIALGSLKFASSSIKQSTVSSKPVISSVGASAFQLPVGSTWTATGGTGMIVYVPTKGVYAYSGSVWSKL